MKNQNEQVKEDKLVRQPIIVVSPDEFTHASKSLFISYHLEKSYERGFVCGQAKIIKEMRLFSKEIEQSEILEKIIKKLPKKLNYIKMKYPKINEKTIYIYLIREDYWVSICGICQALDIDLNKEAKKIKKHEVYGKYLDELFSDEFILPEIYIYAWICGLQLEGYPLKNCCDLICNYIKKHRRRLNSK